MRMKKLDKALREQIGAQVDEEEEVDVGWKPTFVRPTDEEMHEAAGGEGLGTV